MNFVLILITFFLSLYKFKIASAFKRTQNDFGAIKLKRLTFLWNCICSTKCRNVYCKIIDIFSVCLMTTIFGSIEMSATKRAVSCNEFLVHVYEYAILGALCLTFTITISFKFYYTSIGMETKMLVKNSLNCNFWVTLFRSF